jgi:hypothetical protein
MGEMNDFIERDLRGREENLEGILSVVFLIVDLSTVSLQTLHSQKVLTVEDGEMAWLGDEEKKTPTPNPPTRDFT